MLLQIRNPDLLWPVLVYKMIAKVSAYNRLAQFGIGTALHPTACVTVISRIILMDGADAWLQVLLGHRKESCGNSGSENRRRPNPGQGKDRAGKALSLIEAEIHILKEEDE